MSNDVCRKKNSLLELDICSEPPTLEEIASNKKKINLYRVTYPSVIVVSFLVVGLVLLLSTYEEGSFFTVFGMALVGASICGFVYLFVTMLGRVPDQYWELVEPLDLRYCLISSISSNFDDAKNYVEKVKRQGRYLVGFEVEGLTKVYGDTEDTINQRSLAKNSYDAL